jgi:hypothetical protein
VDEATRQRLRCLVEQAHQQQNGGSTLREWTVALLSRKISISVALVLVGVALAVDPMPVYATLVEPLISLLFNDVG